mgnify:CR=1 FL=1
MNFFEHQEQARKQFKWIIWAFVGVTLLIIMAVNVVVLLLGTLSPLSTGGNTVLSVLDPQFIEENSHMLLLSSVLTGGAIGLASLGKIASLRSGGGKVAQGMGATIVSPDTTDPLRRRYYNVVEEIAIASGTPVPDVYVMENEAGINAFAAGYTPTDAAIAVTQGTLEKLSRSELQGVIAHEFSHIFNGDMRINIRMMGVIFGIMVIAILGRKFLQANTHRRHSSRNKNGGAIAVIGLGLMLVGYIGLFFARWMKSALSRQREYLADASAVQFTRDPDGIAGALKKIAAYGHSSYLQADSEEVGHMLFGRGAHSLIFATHPPLERRIARLEKGFKLEDIDQLAKKLKKQEHREHIQAELAEQEQEKKQNQANNGFMDIDGLMADIGNPSHERILAASLLASTLPRGLSSSAHSLEWAPEVLFYCLLDADQTMRDKQLLIVIEKMGDISERKIQHLVQTYGAVHTENRLPILEMSFPTLKRRPINEIKRIEKTIELLANVDNNIDSFEFLLTRLIKQYLFEAHTPNRTRLHGRKKISECADAVAVVMSALAAHGQKNDDQQGLQLMQKSFKQGMKACGIHHKNLIFSGDWQNQTDMALSRLDKLSAPEKSKLIAGLVACVLNDQKVVTAEHEMFRVMCALIHVPIPILNKLV